MQIKQGKPIGANKGLAKVLNRIIRWFETVSPGRGFTFTGDKGEFAPSKYEVLLEAGAGINIACGGDEQPYIISTTGESGGGGAQLSVTGTDGNTATGSNVTIAAASDTNLSALASDDGNGNITLTLGVYYK